MLKTGIKGHRQLFAADVDVLPGVGFAFYQATWLNDHDAVTDESMTTIIPFNNIESIEQMDPVDAKDGDLK